ncbi:MAG TPA: bifunctional lysylphosphatidylglycerol flippase/synthetase MprF [Dokdonella sp.]|nr:bifunctional lysylphosphatidylglycerol flippase/synthetase MprF [Dokdonella sp.]HQY54956.1 bifunctional lysylphosphatidylglycerol flippase/synthetase MprF [Dokdonella sp.]HQZ62318.1 bifunctional lysylphosphatidylglycerol flippase/synthetase MprF [Dokdonella sp.]
MEPHSDQARPQLWRGMLRWCIPLAFLALVAWLVVREIDSLDLPAMQRSLLQMPLLPTLGIAALALGAVAFTGFIDVILARWLRLAVRGRKVFRLAFIANSLSNTLNLSGAMGSAVRLLGFVSMGVESSRAGALIGMQVLSLPLGLSLLVASTLLLGRVPAITASLAQWLVIAVLAAAILYLPLFCVLTARRGLMRWLPAQHALPSWPLKLQLSLLSLIDWLLAAAVLHACLELAGVPIRSLDLLACFAVASVLGLLSLVPGGIGVFDSILVLALAAFGYGQAASLAGLFLFRICYYVLPLFVGLGIGSGMLARRLPLLDRAGERLRRHPLFRVLDLPASLLANLGIRLLAVLTFAAGALLLASAAIPAVREHIEVVRDLLPLAAIESAYWLSILSGVLLLGLGRGIDGRLRLAYRLAMPLLLLSAVLALTKGLHYAEALFLLGVAGLLRLRKREFSQAAMSLSSTVTFGWFAGLLAVVAIFFAIGIGSVFGDDSFDLLYFGVDGHSSRLARGLVAALIGLITYLIWQFFAVRRAPLKLPDREELLRARRLFEEFGGGEFAHLCFMRDKYLFWSADGHAVMACGAVRDRLVALGSPCGSEAARRRAILDFRRFADAQDRVPVFYEVFERDLSLYHDLGFDLFKLGELAIIPLAEFNLSGKRWEDLRHALNRSAREQLDFELIEPPFDTVLMSELEQVSEQWLADKSAREKGFSLGRFDRDYLEWGQIAIVRRAGEIIAFANVLPAYGPGGVLSIDLMRHFADAPRGTMDFLFARIMLWGKEHGHDHFSLGMAPLSRVGDNPYARINERLAALAFEYGGRIYNYQGLRRYKEKFAPQWVGAYLAYPRGLWVPGLLLDIAALVAGGYRRFLLGGRHGS